MKKILSYTTTKYLLFPFVIGALWSSCKNENQAAKQAAPTENTQTKEIVETAINSLKIDFPQFGSYDISAWEKVPVEKKEAEEGDVTTETMIFKKDDLVMQIDTLQSEYYFEIQHTLKNTKGKVQKARSLHFPNDPKELIETINDYTVNPAKKYPRKQAFDKSWQELGKIPTTATGNWQESAADKL